MFYNCSSLQSVPALDVSAVSSSANFASMFTTCRNLSYIGAGTFNYTFSVASCKLSATSLNTIYSNLATTSGQTITITGNYGASSSNTAIATDKGWTVVN